MLTQAVILCGGMGSRLGELTASTPKPLLPVGTRPFIECLIQEVARFGIGRITLLAGRFGSQIYDLYNERVLYGSSIEVVIEPTPMGTGGALRHAMDRLDPVFLLMNGDSWIEADLVALTHAWRNARAANSEIAAQLLLQKVPDAGRFGTVALHDGKIIAFREKLLAAEQRSGLINAGVYILDRDCLGLTPEDRSSSLESDILPKLVAEGRVVGTSASSGAYFVDIGVPESYASAQTGLMRHRTRPALFLDRDGTLNVDVGYTHRSEDLVWQPQAREAIKFANHSGYYVFVVTNQAGVARGLYGENDIAEFHAAMQASLFEIGAHIDAIEWCPHHVDGSIDSYRRECRHRKPMPGMIEELAATWPINMGRSLMIGDSETDMQAAEAAGITGVQYEGGSLLELVRRHLK